jgi:hypothetical protein
MELTDVVDGARDSAVVLRLFEERERGVEMSCGVLEPSASSVRPRACSTSP